MRFGTYTPLIALTLVLQGALAGGSALGQILPPTIEEVEPPEIPSLPELPEGGGLPSLPPVALPDPDVETQPTIPVQPSSSQLTPEEREKEIEAMLERAFSKEISEEEKAAQEKYIRKKRRREKLILEDVKKDIEDDAGDPLEVMKEYQARQQVRAEHKVPQYVQSPYVYRSSYDHQNEHLPKAVTQEDLDQYLFMAAQEGRLDGMRSLLDAGRDPNATTVYGDTPLMVATLAGKTDAVRLLLLRGADPNHKNTQNTTALHIASYKGLPEITQILVHMKADPNARNLYGDTPLMLAASEGHVSVAEMLVNAGADVYVRNNSNMTASDIALRRGQMGMVQALAQMAPAIVQPKPALPTPVRVPAATPVAPVPSAPVMPTMPPQQHTAPAIPPVAPKLSAQPVQPSRPQVAAPVPASAPKMQASQDEQALWNQRLRSWMEADARFDTLTEEEKRTWNQRRKVLMQHFPEYFSANTPEEEIKLRNYLKRWEDLEHPAGSLEKELEKVTSQPGLPAAEPEIVVSEPMMLEEVVTPKAPEDMPIVRALLEEWWITDGKLDTMTDAEIKAADMQRQALLDKLLPDKVPGEYAEAFAALPESEQERLFESMRRWDDALEDVEVREEQTRIQAEEDAQKAEEARMQVMEQEQADKIDVIEAIAPALPELLQEEIMMPEDAADAIPEVPFMEGMEEDENSVEGLPDWIGGREEAVTPPSAPALPPVPAPQSQQAAPVPALPALPPLP